MRVQRCLSAMVVAVVGFVTLFVGAARGSAGTPPPTQQKPVGQDDAKAVQQKAQQGDATAQVQLGNMYSNGQGVPQDLAQAVAWWRKAAEQGHSGAQLSLGISYLNGKGVPLDVAQAVTWFRKAAEQGDPLAQVNLGVIYANGKGVPQDLVEAHKWYNLAAIGPVGDAIAGMFRDRLAQKMTSAQIADAQKRAREWMAAFEKRKK
jgi:TPR repeat protein